MIELVRSAGKSIRPTHAAAEASYDLARALALKEYDALYVVSSL